MTSSTQLYDQGYAQVDTFTHIHRQVRTCFRMRCVRCAMRNSRGRPAMPSPLSSSTSAVAAAASDIVPVTATPTSAAANAGASLMPSPT